MIGATKESKLILVRHAPIADCYLGLCYGQSDVELSPLGEAQSLELANSLAALPVERVVHSGLQRTRILAERLSGLLGLAPEGCELIRERHFGDWELQPWDEIHRRSGDEMLRMITEPATYRPGGGETTFELRDRVAAFMRSLIPAGVTVIVTHAGPISALRGTMQGVRVPDWPGLIPAFGECVTIHLLKYPPQWFPAV